MDTPLAKRLIDAANATYGAHPGQRALHARGLFCRGEFRATGDAVAITSAPHLAGGVVKTTVRFSNGAGHPGFPDGRSVPRGLAVKFHLDDTRFADLVCIDAPVFPVPTPEAFVELLDASRPDPNTGQPNMDAMAAFFARYPRAQAILQTPNPPPESYATLAYHAIHAFRLVGSNRSGYARFHFVPRAGIHRLTDDQAAARALDYLTTELTERLATTPVVFELHLQLAADGDDPADPTNPWPDDRDRVHAGTLEITEVAPDQEALDPWVFDPTNVVDGIELSSDPVLRARGPAYSESYARRAPKATG